MLSTQSAELSLFLLAAACIGLLTFAVSYPYRLRLQRERESSAALEGERDLFFVLAIISQQQSFSHQNQLGQTQVELTAARSELSETKVSLALVKKERDDEAEKFAGAREPWRTAEGDCTYHKTKSAGLEKELARRTELAKSLDRELAEAKNINAQISAYQRFVSGMTL